MEFTFETTVSWEAKWRGKTKEKRRIEFQIPTHSDLLPHLLNPARREMLCYYRYLKFPYSTLKRGAGIRLTAILEQGARGGEYLHVKSIEVLTPVAPSLTKANKAIVKRWEKQIAKTL